MNTDKFKHDESKLTMIDLFCGAGGFAVGCSWAGFESVLGIDHFEPAMRTWSHNHPNAISLFFENKDRFYFPDYKKVNELIGDNRYTKAIDKLLSDYKPDGIFYGIGLPTEKHKEKSKESAHLVDFILGVNTDGSAEILYNPKGIAF